MEAASQNTTWGTGAPLVRNHPAPGPAAAAPSAPPQQAPPRRRSRSGEPQQRARAPAPPDDDEPIEPPAAKAQRRGRQVANPGAPAAGRGRGAHRAAVDDDDEGDRPVVPAADGGGPAAPMEEEKPASAAALLSRLLSRKGPEQHTPLTAPSSSSLLGSFGSLGSSSFSAFSSLGGGEDMFSYLRTAPVDLEPPGLTAAATAASSSMPTDLSSNNMPAPAKARRQKKDPT